MDQLKMPLVQALKAHEKKHAVSFHVPGHKNGLLFPFFDLSFDVTELTGLDDLHAAEECIKKAEYLLSDLYKTEESKFLVNGSTVGNLAMILSAVFEGDIVFVQRNCHKSVLNALKMAKALPVFLEPEYDEQTKTAVLVSINTLKQAYSLYKKVKAVIFTYPTYYGMTGSFEELAVIAKANGSLVLVDEAHGAHFLIDTKGVPSSSLQLGADAVVQSAHKMLPAMTMGSYLHIQSKQIDKERIRFYLQALQSSSPSYPIMASLDYARAYLASYTKEDAAYAMQVKQNVVELLESKGLDCIMPDDPFKLIVRAKNATGFELQALFEEAGAYIELADPFQVLLLFPLVKKGKTAFEKRALQKLHKLRLPKEKPPVNFPEVLKSESVSILALPYNEHSSYKKTAVAFKTAADEISAETIIPYPPGIPLLIEGERISENHIKKITWLLESKSHFQGGSRLGEKEIVVFRKEI